MNKNQKGFAILETLLTLVVIGVITGTGWYAWHSKNQTDKILAQADKTSQSTSTKTSSPKVPTAPTVPASGTAIKSADGGVGLTLPQGWSITSRVDGGNFCGFAPTVSADGTCISDIVFTNTQDPSSSGYVKIFKSSDSAAAWHSNAFGSCSNPVGEGIDNNSELICHSGTSYEATIGNGSYIVYFAGDNSAGYSSIVDSLKFL